MRYLIIGLVLLLPSLAEAQTLLTDFTVRPEPALPTMGAAGSKIVDPTFGTTILRLTDASSDASGAGTLYSTYPSVNVNSTRVMGRSNANSNAIFWQLNASAFTVSNRTTFTFGSPNLYTYYFVWSGTNPDVVWGTGHQNQGADAAKLYTFNVATQVSTLIKDFSGLTLSGVAPHSGASLNQMSMSKDDNIFSATVQTSGGGTRGAIVYRRTPDTLLMNLTGTDIDETYIDKSGEYVTVIRGGCSTQVYRVSTGLSVGTVSGLCHNGQGTRRTVLNGSNAIGLLDFSTMTTTNIQNGFWTQTSTRHESWNQTDETYALISGYRDADAVPGIWNAFDNELTLVRMDGVTGVRRLAHHRSNTNGGSTYSATPFANISPDGQFVAFTSTWGTNLQAGGRIDLYLVKVPTNAVQDSTPPLAPTNPRISS